MAWVKAKNDATIATLSKTPVYQPILERTKRILDSRDRIAMPGIRGDRLYNFWQDAQHQRGILRRTTWQSYLSGTAAWETVLDVDSLAKAEGVRWSYGGSECLDPEYRRCLISLARGGSDLVGTDFGTGSMTASGYPRIVKRWKRGTPLAQAEKVVQLDVPEDADLYLVRDQLVVYVRDPWTTGGTTWSTGSLAAMNVDEFLAGRRASALVMKPGPREAINSISATRDHMLVNVLNDVRGELRRYSARGGKWTFENVPAPDLGSIGVQSATTWRGCTTSSRSASGGAWTRRW